MRGQSKTKGQLINELNKPRHRIIEQDQLKDKRKQAREALWESENYYRKLVENLPQKIFLKDKNSVYLSCNENYSRDLKIRPDEITGKTDYDFYPKELAGKYQADDKRIMESGKTGDIEETYIQDGKEVIVHTVKTPIKDGKGKILGILGIFWDITKRKHADDELKKYRERLEELVNERTAQLRNANEQLQREITERKRAEEALQKSEEEAKRLAQENAIMAEIGRIISSTLNIDEVYERFAEETRKLLPFDRIAIQTINLIENTATFAYLSGIDVGSRRLRDTMPLSGSVTTECIRTQSSLLFQPESIDEVVNKFPNLLPGFKAGIRSMMFVPLISKDQVIGVLSLQTTRPNAYTERDLRLAERVSNQIAGAIANTELFAEYKRTEETL
jgi:PAS domain S-box-containing protein